MQRSLAPEIMDNPQMPDQVWERFHKELTAIHHILGDIRTIESAIEHDTLPVRRVVDLGCGSARMLGYLRKRLGIEVVGIDKRIPKIRTNGVEFIQGNAITTKLPRSDVAIALGFIHHLSDFEVIDLIRNVTIFAAPHDPRPSAACFSTATVQIVRESFSSSCDRG